MNRARLEKYADTILKGYIPLNEHYARFEVENNIHHHKMKHIHSLIMAVPLKVDATVKEQVADQTVEKLKAVYQNYI